MIQKVFSVMFLVVLMYSSILISEVYAAIAFDVGTNSSIANPGTSLTFSHTVTGSNTILFVCAMLRTGYPTGVTYNSVAMTKVATSTLPWSASGLDPTSMWMLVNPATGANNVVITGNAATELVMGAAQSYTGAKQTGQPDASTTNLATTTSLATSVTVVAKNSWAVLCARAETGGTSSAGANTTQRTNTNGQIQTYDGNQAYDPGSQTLTITMGGTWNTGTVMASFAPKVDAGNAYFKKSNGYIKKGSAYIK